jgi:phenylacetate-CoA ligase
LKPGFSNLNAKVPMQLDDPTLDSADPDAREAWLLEAVCAQITYMRATVPFWHERLSNASVDEHRLECLADLASVPIFTKAELRATPPIDLLPSDTRSELKICRWTSGTSGRPTVNFWSETDWAALVAATARMIGRHAPMRAPTVFNAYSQAHVTGPLYNAALRQIGAIVYDRSHHPEEVFSTLEQSEQFAFDTIILPAKSARGKGVGLADLLDQEPNFIARKQVRWWIGSSGTFDAEIVQRAQAQGTHVVTNLYGSSEFALFAVSCSKERGDYHVSQGHVLVEVVDQSGTPVQTGKFGRIVVTHLCGMDETGKARNHGGTQMLRLAAGDGATLFSEPCTCGLTAPRLRGIRRIAATE